MKIVFTPSRSTVIGRTLMMVGILLLSAPSQACDADEMVAQMRSACTEMVSGFQKASGKSASKPAAQELLTQARAHCQALQFDNAGLKLALAVQSSSLPAKAVVSTNP